MWYCRTPLSHKVHFFSLFLSQQGQTHIFKNHLEKTAWQKWGMQWSTWAQKFKVRISYGYFTAIQVITKTFCSADPQLIHCQLGTHVVFCLFLIHMKTSTPVKLRVTFSSQFTMILQETTFLTAMLYSMKFCIKKKITLNYISGLLSIFLPSEFQLGQF